MNEKTNRISEIFKGILAIFLYFFLSSFPQLFIKILGINFYNLNNIFRQIYLILYELFITILILYIYKKDIIPNFKNFKSNIKEYINKYIKYWFIMLGLMILSNFIITLFTTTKVSNNQSDIIKLLGEYPIYTFFATVLFAPILEELIFRLSIKKIFNNDTLFIIISGLLFGSLHVIGNFNSLIDLLFIIPYSIPGFIFAYLYSKSKNICVPIGLHFLHNSIMILLQTIVTFIG